MEIKINKEIRDYTEGVFFGLSLRQLIFSALACGVAVLLFFTLRPSFGIETLSWVCILGAAPFAAVGFIKYHGMTAEQFIFAWFKSEVLYPKRLVFKAENIYFEMLNQPQPKEQEDKTKDDQNTQKTDEAGEREV